MRVDISESFDVICVCRVWPVVIKFPLMSSTLDPVETRLEETVLTLSVKVFPVAIRLELTVFIFVVSVWPVVIRLPLNVSTLPLKAGSELEPVVKPETIAISSVRYWPVVIKLPLKSLTFCPPAIPETIFIPS